MKTGIFTRKSALPIILATFLLILVPITIVITSASVTELNVNPQEVDPGDTVTISGKASIPEEEVWISSSFELSLDVLEGKYSREFINIYFPPSDGKRFSVTAKNVNNLQVSLSPVFRQTITITCSGQTMTVKIWAITKTYPIEDINETGVAKFSFELPFSIPGLTLDISGEKDITVEGDSADGATSVNLNVDTSINVTADSNGNFSLDLNTEGVPEGEFSISAGGIEKKVYIGVPAPSPTPTPSSNGEDEGEDGGGGSGGAAPETTPTHTPATAENVTSNETTPTPTPTLIPTPTPASTTTPPQTTVIENETSDKTPGPTPQNETNQTPQETTEPVSTPGFEAIGYIAIAALIMVIMKMVLVYR
ncbi:MAG: hypothetical protein WBC40_05165 [Halobacteriota archaeon]